jgi:hypothetical protein
VEGEFAEQFAGGGVDDADVQVVDEQDDMGPGVRADTGAAHAKHLKADPPVVDEHPVPGLTSSDSPR